jgi:hypothetical protein
VAPDCKADKDDTCFTSSNEKICQHQATRVELNQAGDYIVLPSRFYHRRYYRINSNMTYYTATLFCTLVLDNAADVWQNVTRKINTTILQGQVEESSVQELTDDIKANWDTTYCVNQFPHAKKFGSDNIDPTKNRHILRPTFPNVPMISKLVKYFDNKYDHIEVRSVWLIEKSRENDGFQGWHRDFFLGTEVTITIVVNVGAIMKN